MVLKKCILALETGKIFEGFSCGYDAETGGEVVFNTGIFGYQEVATDPASYKQLICFAHPHVGNCGFNIEDSQSEGITAFGFFFKEYSRVYSNWRAKNSMQEEILKAKVPAMEGFDTRALVKYIRENGTMRGIISTKDYSHESLVKKAKSLQENSKLDLVKEVTCSKKYSFNENSSKATVAIIDFGCTKSLLDYFASTDFKIVVFPANTQSNDILKENPDGIFLSSGPGYAINSDYAVKTVKEIIAKNPKMPIFATGFGLDILALSFGLKILKHKIGHRGANYPVKNLSTNAVEITLQNNGYFIDEKTFNGNLKITHVNLYDNTIAGFENNEGNIFGICYYPAPNSDETGYLFKKFFSQVVKNA
ncbi:MAG: glutamine-hydrolyzing carbamoyl-phosphate synthase small subunit [Endomicrobiaceae bacterium]|jgi:carbamoyl-phosphate synthase small subunit|nr:glutamine-hydrolyzing carbamoyl-phosphate synthase small subunit [Endomicrobiaceae bacterium]MDD3729564.1 glutamine-hydrolyzing carbamoyl-phosphate synthase small subunit [Endomicrobiaceae bacterium]MDD4165644.1 glutamine-hydrolyzing carbamoyl-phosphate synthase small subunit [Endomicrobiaceae bacterium]